MHLIPMIDVGSIYTAHEDELDEVSLEIKQAFSSTGVAFLVNHQIPDHIFDEILMLSRAFHQLPLQDKKNMNLKIVFPVISIWKEKSLRIMV